MSKACVEDKRPSQGGIATGLGECVISISPTTWSDKCLGDGGIGLFITQGYPNVRCDDTAPASGFEASCNWLMNSQMHTDADDRTFGNQGSGADVELPLNWDAGSSHYLLDFPAKSVTMANVECLATVPNCVMTLRTLGPTDTTSWNAIWSAATFISAMCARQGKGGVHALIGELAALFSRKACMGRLRTVADIPAGMNGRLFLEIEGPLPSRMLM